MTIRKYIHLICFITIIIFSSCAEFSVKTEVEKSSGLSQLKSCGILFRLPKDSIIEVDNYVSNLSQWLENYIKNIKLNILPKTGEEINYFNSINERFYQQ